jgi:CubicO group peptidase (beta-lactamase class C family)
VTNARSGYKILMMKRTATVILLTGLALRAGDQPNPANSGMDGARLAKIPQRMKEFVDAGKAAGIVTLVARHGQLASLDAVGYQELETKTPMRTDTIVRIASLTKPITCAGIMVLVDEGRISVLDPVEKYVPEFKGQKVSGCSAAGGCSAVAPSRYSRPDDAHVGPAGCSAW